MKVDSITEVIYHWVFNLTASVIGLLVASVTAELECLVRFDYRVEKAIDTYLITVRIFFSIPGGMRFF